MPGWLIVLMEMFLVFYMCMFAGILWNLYQIKKQELERAKINTEFAELRKSQYLVNNPTKNSDQ